MDAAEIMIETFPASPVDSRKDSRRRYVVILVLLFGSGVLSYVDRQTLSILKPTLKASLGMDESGYAFLVNIFTVCYAVAYIGSGWLTDKIGSRRGLILFVSAWSLATIGCGLSTTMYAFVFCQALLGFAEPGQQPVAMRTLTLWTPFKVRGLTMSIVGAGGTVGSILAAPLIASLATHLNWHVAFIIPGVVGLAIGIVWWFIYRDPALPVQTASALATPPPAMPWSQLWRQRSLWGIVLARFISDPVWYFCLFWMPGYFQEQRGLSLQQSGFVGWIPFFAASIGGITLAGLSDRLGRHWQSPMLGRIRLLGILACFGPVAMLIPHMPTLPMTIFLLCIVAVVCLAWLNIIGPLVADVFPAGNAASVWGISGAFGATGAMIFNHQVGKITSAVGSANMFLVLGCLHLIAAAIIFGLVRKANPNPAP